MLKSRAAFVKHLKNQRYPKDHLIIFGNLYVILNEVSNRAAQNPFRINLNKLISIIKRRKNCEDSSKFFNPK